MTNAYLRSLIALASAFTMITPMAHAESIASARYDTPVTHYGHFAAGRPHEYARLTVTTNTGRQLVLELPDSEVFEDVAPRLVRLSGQGALEILTIISARASGARLALVGLAGNRLEIVANSPAIGTPMRWMNPVGVADLDGDGHAEIAAVTTPHIGGTLRVYRRAGNELVQVASLAGFSNHVYGSPDLRLSLAHAIDGQMRLLVPDNPRTTLRIVELRAGSLVETGRCPLRAPVTGALTAISANQISVGLADGPALVDLRACASAPKR